MPAERTDITRWYADHSRRVWRTLLRLGVPPSVVEDAVQDVFLTAHQRLGTFEGRAQPSTWLLGIAVRVAANARRRSHLSVVLSDTLVDPARAPDEALEHQRALEALEQVLAQLPQDQREVVVLVDLEHLSGPEVAEALEVKLNTVYSRLRLGRAALAAALLAKSQNQPPKAAE